MKIAIQVFNKSNNILPKYETLGAAGMDLLAFVNDKDPLTRILIHPHQHILVHTGLYVAIPEGYELQIRARSGLALKKGITVLNGIGTIDCDYRGEIGVIIVNHSNETVGFINGDKIAQAVLKKVENAEWNVVNTFEELPLTNRGTGGFGSTTKIEENVSIQNVIIDHSDIKPLEGTILDHMDNIK